MPPSPAEANISPVGLRLMPYTSASAEVVFCHDWKIGEGAISAMANSSCDGEKAIRRPSPEIVNARGVASTTRAADLSCKSSQTNLPSQPPVKTDLPAKTNC